jgi:UDP-N-acetylmuramate: L-alanyl-gamma-D-glutamyl-meso-diaminopimelate ligase
VCRELGVGTPVFIKAIADFAGAAKRLELLSKKNSCNIYRDFAHAPSKVKATIEAVKQQFPERKLIAVLELHTYSSLNENFMKEYNGAMNDADEAVVFYSSHALELKRMPELPKEKVKQGFAKDNLLVINKKEDLEQFLQKEDYSNSNLLLMSSGNYDGLDILKQVIGK